MRRLRLLGSLLLPAASVVFAGTPLDPGFDVRTWRSDDGLPSDAVIAVAQTPDGYLWVGTNAGLARFDGLRFAVFDHRSSPALQSDQCGPLDVDASGALWIGTMGGGLTRYAEGVFTGYGRNEGSTYEYIMSMFRDGSGRLWLGTNDRLHIWDGSRFKVPGVDDGMTFARPVPVTEDSAGRVWVQNFDGRFGFFTGGRFRESSGEGELFPDGFSRPLRHVRGADGTRWIVQSNPNRLTRWEHGGTTAIDVGPRSPVDAISRIVQTRSGDVWIGLRESGLRLLRNGSVRTLGTAEGLPQGPVSALLEDREGNVWVGTSGGLTRIRPKTFASLGGAGDLGDAGGLAAERTWAVFEDRRRDLWIGTDLLLWRLHEGRLARYGLAEGLPALGVVSFAEDAAGNVWIGTTKGLARFDGSRFVSFGKPDGLPNENVRALFTDRDGKLWIGTAGGLAVMEGGRFRSFTTADGLAGDWVRFIDQDRAGDMWFATISGVSRLHEGRFTTFRAADGLADDRVLAIVEAKDGAHWFGTYRGGLSRLKDGRFATVSRASGLHDDTILRILEDDRDNFWMSTPHGIFRASRRQLDDVADGRTRSLASIVYDKTDGMPTIDCGGGTQPAGCRARDGRMWFPTGRGVTFVDPSALRSNAVPPPVHIEEVLYDRIHPGGPSHATLPAGSKTVELHYTATTLSRPERARFRYRLAPFDPDWVDAGTLRTAYYTALRPGRYRFQVIAANESDVWNETGATYDLEVEPHVYETKSFYAACALLIGLLGFGGYRLRIRQIESRYAAVLSERGRIARELHDTIAQGFTGVSMQLEAVSAKLGEAPEEIRENLDRARLLVRTSLHDARRSVRALRPQLLESSDLPTALRAIAAQLTAGTETHAVVRTRGRLRRLPPEIEDMLFRVGQEAMTNAVRHGGCRALEIDLEIARDALSLSIADDGSGFDPERSKEGSGLAGMRERLDAVGGKIDVTTASGHGTRVVATVPLRRGRKEESV